MNTPIGLQLYSVREQLKQDFSGTIKQISGMGYVGVETAGFPQDINPATAKKIFDDQGLIVTSSHSPLPLGEDKEMILDTLAVISCPHLVSPWMNPDFYSSEEKMKSLADMFNQAHEVAAKNGMKFSIHNHAFEFSIVNDKPALYTLMKYLEPGIHFQLDTYWIKVAGLDPAKVVEELGKKVPLLHIKDGPATPDGDMTAVGDGVLDIPAIIKAGEPYTEWMIVEIDRCATDMLEAVAKSRHYLATI